MIASASILWRRLDLPGHDSARLTAGPAGPLLEGTAVFAESHQVCLLHYRVTCDAQWRTIAAQITGWVDTAPVDVDIVVDAARVWTVNGHRCPDLTGCLDLDLSFTPATNTLPIRRSRLTIGGRADVRVAWLPFPGPPALEALEQTYERVGGARYRFTADGGAFESMLDTNVAGFVTSYPGLWRQESG